MVNDSTNTTRCWSLYCDGASRGNPGKAAIGAALYPPKAEEPSATCSEAIGIATNNVAEYRALIAGVALALKQSELNELKIYLDSELIVKQLKGLYKVKHPAMQPLYREVNELLKQLPLWQIEHVPRSRNSVADRLANQALDVAK